MTEQPLTTGVRPRPAPTHCRIYPVHSLAWMSVRPSGANNRMAARKGVLQVNEYNAQACLTLSGRGFDFIGEFRGLSNLSSPSREARE